MKESKKVLVVDDQQGIRHLLSSVVEEVGGKAYTAQNGLEAVEIVRKVRPHLVFMDVKMPVMGGLEALGVIREIAPETEVVMMTAYISEEVIRRAEEKGALCCLVKPFEVEDIKRIILKEPGQNDKR
mgnify:CR=1 FL=1